jgi:hypothetical protein
MKKKEREIKYIYINYFFIFARGKRIKFRPDQ